MLEPLVDVCVFAVGATLVCGFITFWRRTFPRKLLVLYSFAVLLFFSPALLTSRQQVPTDIAFLTLPWADKLPQRVTPRNPLLLDTLYQILPYRKLVRHRLGHGEIPFWSHELGTGQPLLGNGQSAVWSPLHLLALPLPPARGLTVTAALTVLLSLLLMHAFLAELGASTLGSMLGATAFAFSTFSVVWVYYLIMPTVAWLPGILLSLLLLRRGAKRGLLGLIVCTAGSGLSGHASTLTNVIVVAAVVGGVLLLKSGGTSRVRFASLTLLAVALGAAMAAPALVPFAEAMSESHRFDIGSSAFRQETRFETERLLVVASPLAFGYPNDHTWDGPRNFAETATSYAGALTLALGLLGLVADRRTSLVLLGGTVALVAAIWRGGPRLVFPLVFRDADRLQFVWVFAVCVAAGLVFTQIERSEGGVTRVVPQAAGAFVFVLLLLRPGGGAWQQACWALAVLSVLVLLAWSLLRRPMSAVVGTILVVLLGAELFVLGMGYNPALPSTFRLGVPTAVAHLHELTKLDRTERVIGDGHNFRPGLPALYELWDPRGNDPMRPVHPFRLLRRFTSMRQGYHEVKLQVNRTLQPILNYMRVRYALTAHSRELPPPWELHLDVAGGRIWANREVLPLFFSPSRVETAAPFPEGLPPVVRTADFSEVAYVSEPRVSGRNGSAAVRSIEPISNGFRVGLEADADALIVSSVSYSKLWTATVDGAAAPVTSVNGAFVGFWVPAGRHAVTLNYAPRFWSVAVALFFVSLFVVVALIYLDIRPRPVSSRTVAA